jgi:hypothetical protein
MATGRIYFHSPCFDGIASAVIAWDFLEKTEGWVGPLLLPVNYGERTSWLQVPLEHPSAVVDFLYHPSAHLWADHHGTTFLTDASRHDFTTKRDPRFVYDATAGSCAMLLWEHLYSTFGHRNDRYHELALWADKIDAARYTSVDEAMSSDVPALKIAKGLGVSGTRGYSERLVESLRSGSLVEVAELPEVRERFVEVERLSALGWERFRKAVHIDDNGIAVFDVDGQDVFINRYGAFRVFPNARYSAGILRFRDSAKITVMRNPWLDFGCPPLGKIAEKFGGGGHRRIGSINLRADQAASAQTILARFLDEMQSAEATEPTAPR